MNRAITKKLKSLQNGNLCGLSQENVIEIVVVIKRNYNMHPSIYCEMYNRDIYITSYEETERFMQAKDNDHV